MVPQLTSILVIFSGGVVQPILSRRQNHTTLQTFQTEDFLGELPVRILSSKKAGLNPPAPLPPQTNKSVGRGFLFIR